MIRAYCINLISTALFCLLGYRNRREAESLLTDPRVKTLMTEKRTLENKLAEYMAAEQHRKNTKSRLDQIFSILDSMKNHPMTFDNEIIRKILQCVIVESKDKIKVVFIGGLEVEEVVEQ